MRGCVAVLALCAVVPACGLYSGDGAPGDDDYVDESPDGAPPSCPPGEADGSVETVAFDRDRPVAIAADATHVYWIEAGHLDENGNPTAGSLVRAALDGGPPVLVVGQLSWPSALAVHDGFVYWSDRDGLWRVATSGGPPTAISATVVAFELAVQDGRVYWTSVQPSQVGVVDVDGDGLAVIDDAADTDYFALTVDATHLYWGTGSEVFRAPIAGDGPAEVVYARIASQLVRAGDHLFVADDLDGRVARVDLADGSSVNLMPGDGRNIAIALDGDDVLRTSHALDGEACGVIARAPTTPGPSTVLVGGQERISGVVVTDTHVWWASEGQSRGATGAIRRLPR